MWERHCKMQQCVRGGRLPKTGPRKVSLRMGTLEQGPAPMRRSHQPWDHMGKRFPGDGNSKCKGSEVG